MTEKSAVPAIAFNDGGVSLTSLEDAYRFSQAVVNSGLAPSGFDTPEKVLIAVQTGAEVGLPAMASLQSLFVYKGRVGWMVKAIIALIHKHDLCVKGGFPKARFERLDVKSTTKVDDFPDDYRCIVTAQRKNCDREEFSFSVDDAKRLGKWAKKTTRGEDTPWISAPDDMLYARAIGRMTRRRFTDVTLGLPVSEELYDYGGMKDITPQSQEPPQNPDPLLTMDFAGGVPSSTEEPPATEDAPGEPDEPDSQPVEVEPVPYDGVSAKAWILAVEKALGEAEDPYAVWDANLTTFTEIQRQVKSDKGQETLAALQAHAHACIDAKEIEMNRSGG